MNNPDVLSMSFANFCQLLRIETKKTVTWRKNSQRVGSTRLIKVYVDKLLAFHLKVDFLDHDRIIDWNEYRHIPVGRHSFATIAHGRKKSIQHGDDPAVAIYRYADGCD